MSRVCNASRDKTMSYILDALKRADAERERGAVPGLHAQQNTALAPTPLRNARTRLWLISGTVLVLSAISAGLWLWSAQSHEASLPAVQLAMVPPLVNVPTTTPAPAPTPTPAPTLPAAGVAPSTPASTPPALALATVPPAAAAVPAPAPTNKPTVSSAAPKAAAPTPPSAAPAPPAAAEVPLLSELPEDFRRQLPALAITGAVYSQTPAQRLLLVNNQVLNQGSLAAPELTLEEIRPRSSVFNFRGTRFRLAH